MFLGFLGAKPCRIIWKLRSKLMSKSECAKFVKKSEIGHVHEHQKLQVRAKPSRKLFFWRPKAPIEGDVFQKNSTFCLRNNKLKKNQLEIINLIKVCFSGRFRPHLELLVLMDMSDFRLFIKFRFAVSPAKAMQNQSESLWNYGKIFF